MCHLHAWVLLADLVNATLPQDEQPPECWFLSRDKQRACHASIRNNAQALSDNRLISLHAQRILLWEDGDCGLDRPKHDILKQSLCSARNGSSALTSDAPSSFFPFPILSVSPSGIQLVRQQEDPLQKKHRQVPRGGQPVRS